MAHPFHLLGMNQARTGVLGGSSIRKYQSAGMEAQAQAGCTEYKLQFVVRADDLYFRRKYLKGSLSIPCDGRGARRPLGQSFRKSVGPPPVPLSTSTVSKGE